jgi:UDP:flavonoid glycosyltransferase YjiC (YdhE family)
MKIGLQTWGSEGDIMPFTALAAGLVEAGHEVTLAVTDNVGRDYGGLAARFGYQLLAVPNPAVASEHEAQSIWRAIIEAGNPIRQAELVMKYGFDPAVENMYASAQQLCGWSDAVIGHFFVFPLRVAAEKLHVPMASLNVVHNCIPSKHIQPPGLPNLGPWSYAAGWFLVRRMVNRIFLPRVNALREREGQPPDRDVMEQTWAAKQLNLVAVSPTICHRPPDWQERHQVCGFLNPPATLESYSVSVALAEFLAAGKPPVYMTFGSMMLNQLDYIRETVDIWIEAIRLAKCRAVLQVPWDDLLAFPKLDQVLWVTRSPYKQVFPRCSLVVHHGGAGTTQSSLLAGCPSIVVAHMADQYFWGAELERLGVAGRTLKRKGLNANDLAKAIEEVCATPAMRDRAQSIGQSVAQENGVRTAIRLVESRLLGQSS